MQKVITREQLGNYLDNKIIGDIFDPKEIRGFIARHSDVAEPRNPTDLQEGLRLDYHDPGYVDRNGREPYNPDDDTIEVLRTHYER